MATIAAASNRLTELRDGAGVLAKSFAHTPGGDTASVTLASGPAQTYAYDARGRLESVSLGGTVQASYAYDYTGQRVVRSVAGASVHYLFDAAGHLLAEHDGASGQVIREYVWLGDTLLAVGTGPAAAPQWSFVTTGNLGEPLMVTDAAGAITSSLTRDPWGNPILLAAGAPLEFSYPGQWDANSACTQAFNTTTSMGRLTLNVLLSFAQFEREVTGERIRDKIAASKKKGIWMGGPVPLGYQVIERKLVPVPEEAERVRTIMRRYLEVRNVPALIGVLGAEGVVTKVQQRVSGPHRGGIPFARGSLFHLLKNPVYRGKIVHKGKVFDGEHEAIVDEDLWDAVQAQLAAKAPPRRRATNQPQQARLRGLITDPHGRPMVPTYGSKGPRHYAYYETRKDLARPGDPPGMRFQRGHLESHLITHLERLLGDEHALRRLSGLEDAGTLRTLFANAHLLALRMAQVGSAQQALQDLVAAIAIQISQAELALNANALGIDTDAKWTWTIPLPSRKPFREARLRIDGDAGEGSAQNDLLLLIAEAFAVQRLVLESPELNLAQLARREGRCRTQLARLLRLSWMSPRIIEAIAAGTQPKGLTRRLLLIADMPADWSAQERHLGLAA